MRIILSVILLFCLIGQGKAQGSDFSFSIGGGLNLTHSDIESDNGFFGALGIAYRPSPYFDIEANGIVGSLAGDERRGGEELSFTNSTTQFVLRGNLYLLSLLGGSGDKIDLFATAGAGLLVSNVTAITTPENDPWGNRYAGTDLYLPVGAGLVVPLSSSLALRLQLLYNIAFMDDLDGYNPQVAANQANDRFTNVGIGITFRPGNRPVKEVITPAVTEEDVLTQEEVEETDVDTTEENENTTEEPTIEEDEEVTEEPVQDTEPVSEDEKEDPADEPVSEEQQDITQEPQDTIAGNQVSLFQDPVFNLNGSRANKRYYVIGASFRTMAQAQEYQFNMASLGYATLIITDYEKKLYRISFGAFMDLSAAQKQANKLRKEHDPDTWIIENTAPR